MALTIPKPNLPDEYLVDNRVYTDQRVFDLEMENIFLKVWNFVCHESEIPEPGDFMTATIAGQPIIVCRNREGRVRAFFNTCRHRGAQVEFARSGNTKAFTCLYHLWTYDLDGGLIGVPEIEAYETSYNPKGLCKEEFGLVPVRLDSLHRLVFVTFDDATPPLDEFLGDMAGLLEHPFSSPDFHIKVVRQNTLRANWKMQPENSRDGYHAPLLHKRLRNVSPPRPYRVLTNGHTIQFMDLDYETGLKNKTVDKELLDDPEMTRSFMSHPLPGITREDPAYVVQLFPDALILVRYSTVMMERQNPLGPGETVVEFCAGELRSDTDEVRSIRQRHWDLYWSHDKGNLPEDWEAWEAQQRGVAGIGSRYSLMARGEPALEGLRGDDNRLRSFWTEWRKYMGTTANAPPGS